MRIIIAIDQTEFARHIIDSVIKRHWPSDTQFKVLTVLEPLQWNAVPCVEWNKAAEEASEKRKHFAHELLMESKHKIDQAVPQAIVHVETRHGSPREQIVDAAAEWMADKIVLGAHGHSPNRLFAGSVSRAVAQHAGCSVELIRLGAPLEKSSSRMKTTTHATLTKR